MDLFDIIGFIVNCISLAILIYQVFEYSVERCKENRLALSEEQMVAQILEIVKKIDHEVLRMRRTSED